MALGVHSRKKPDRGVLRLAVPFACLGLALGSTSCVPVAASQAPISPLAAPAAPAFTGASPAAPLAFPVNPPQSPALQAASSYVFEAHTPLDRLRSLDCLAQAIYYEARSESEDGQRAVAQVVLNRVRHPAWPHTVCGVVYQGPLRDGGGCQFTFTCDGSLAFAPVGPAWARARQIATEALAGRVYAPVGLSTHYHTLAVSPAWAPRLMPTAIIGAHEFYRLPGLWGEAGAFTARYSGGEPLPRPALFMPRRAPAPLGIADVIPAMPSAAAVQAMPTIRSDIPPDPRWTASNLPESTVRDEYRNSGQWRSDAPAAVTGAH